MLLSPCLQISLRDGVILRAQEKGFGRRTAASIHVC
jgi:hypothetical protein